MGTPEGRTATIVGGGIAGLATALALHRTGWQVTVRERRPAVDRGGAGLVLWPNALRCLDALGVGVEVRARATELSGASIRRADGRVLSTVGPTPRSGQERPVGLVRADLVDVLTDALDPSLLLLGAEVVDTDSLVADLVVGADGLHSAVRRSLGGSAAPTHRGYTVWRAVVEARAGDSQELSETWGAGVRFGSVPVGPDRSYVYAAARPGGTADLAWLRECFGDWHAPVPALLAAIDPATLLRHDIHDLPPGRTPLHRDRRVLVGDAGHAMEPNLGQGAGLALEDAVVLAHALAGERSVEPALAAYAASRRRRVTMLARQSRRIGALSQLTHPVAVALRDGAVRWSPDRLARRASATATGWRPPTLVQPTLTQPPAQETP